MANNRQVKRSIKQIQRVKTWQLIVLLIIAALLSATFLRLNNIGMVERRTAVLKSDKAGDEQALHNNLFALQRYVSSHMNADPGRIALEYSYERASNAAKKAAEKANSGRVGVNAAQKAAQVCDPIALSQGWRWPDPRYINCVDTELKKYPSTGSLQSSVALPNVNLYYHTFYSPQWSPDFAGWSLVLCGLIVLVILARGLSLLILKALLRRHYSSI